jgi:hypothetical protein
MLVTASAELSWVGYAAALKRRGVNVVSFLVNAATFGGKQSNAGLGAALWGMGLPAYAIQNGVDFATAVLTLPSRAPAN